MLDRETNFWINARLLFECPRISKLSSDSKGVLISLWAFYCRLGGITLDIDFLSGYLNIPPVDMINFCDDLKEFFVIINGKWYPRRNATKAIRFTRKCKIPQKVRFTCLKHSNRIGKH